MDIKISQQIPATYARNHFKEFTNRVLEEGVTVVVRKSEPVFVALSMEEYNRVKEAEKSWLNRNDGEGPKKKITLEELRKNSKFNKYIGYLEGMFPPEMSSVEIAKHWTDYVD